MSQYFIFIATKTTADAAVPLIANNQADFNRRVSNAFRAQGGGRLTIGDLKLRPTSAAVPNHLLCDGSAVSRFQFSELFRFLGVTEGAGDGVTTFNLPNYLAAAVTIAATAPAQTVTEGGTTSTGAPITEPSGTAQTGGTEGGNVVTGGRTRDLA